MEYINKEKKPVGYELEEEDQELLNLRNIPSKDQGTRPVEYDDYDQYSDDENKKRSNTNIAASTPMSTGNMSTEKGSSMARRKITTPAKDDS